MKRFAVVITGLDGAGKSTTAGYIASLLPGEVRPIAESLRMEVSAKFPGVDFWVKPTPPKVREMMIEHGNIRRCEDPNYFVKKWYVSVGEGTPIIDDLRYPSELDYVRQYFEVYHAHLYRECTREERIGIHYHSKQNSWFSPGADCVIQAHSIPAVDIANSIIIGIGTRRQNG
jgi:hypothetical protein